MSERLKYGETYESIAKKIEPYLNNSPTTRQTYNPSIYPIWWDSHITIFNRYEHPQTQMVTWYKNVLSRCFIQSAKSMISAGQITYDTSSVVLKIPQNDNFREYGEWIQIPNTDKSQFFTLHQGDIIVKGIIDDVIDEYTTGLRASDLISKYKNIGICFTIDRWQDNTGAGRGVPHYFANGE